MMKKVLVILAAMMAVVMPAKSVEFKYEAGADVVSSYIWRGQYNGGLSFQPEVLLGFDALDEALQFRAGFWGNVGASDWKFKKNGNVIPEVYNPNTQFMPEVDFEISFFAFGASVGFNEYYYCDDGSTHMSELWVGYNFSHFFGDKAGAYINWYSAIAGAGVDDFNDPVWEDPLRVSKKYSSYLELGYDYTFENIGLTLGAQVGISPWQSELYGNDKFAVTNVSLKIDKEWEIGPCTIDIFAQGSINPDGINKENVFINAAGDDKLYLQKLNGAIGFGIWFGN